MRHLKQGKKLGRTAAPRYALLRSLAESIILHGSIKTTAGKAKALRVFVEPLVTKAKKHTLVTERKLREVLYTDTAFRKLLTEWGPKYASRPGGYTRIIKLGTRGPDAAPMARVEFV